MAVRPGPLGGAGLDYLNQINPARQPPAGKKKPARMKIRAGW